VPFTSVDFSALAEAEQGPAIEAAATELQTSLNLSTGPLMRCSLRLGCPCASPLAAHHPPLGRGWRLLILLEDLQTAYQQLSRKETMQLPAKTTFQHWSYRAGVCTFSTTAATVLAGPVRRHGGARCQWTIRGNNTVASTQQVSTSLSVEETQALLQEVPKAYTRSTMCC